MSFTLKSVNPNLKINSTKCTRS